MRNYFFLLLLFIAGFSAFIGSSGCANIIPPAGGPKDTIPPQLLKAEPLDSTTHFNQKEINLHFNEYVDLRDPINNILFTPTFDNRPDIVSQGRNIRIRFKDTLEPNTTYVINFGNAIIDVNEGNPLGNFVYSFSTGAVMDSLEISGRVLLAETGGIDSANLSVILHRKLYDSAVVKERPPYVVRLNQQGEFRFRYLPSDSFAIYAIGTGGIGWTYSNKSQLFAFADQHIVSGTDSIILYAYREKAAVSATNVGGVGLGQLPGRISATDRRLRMTPPTTNQDLQTDYIINFSVPLRQFDSTKVQLTTDTVFTPVAFTAMLDSTRKQMRIKTTWIQNTAYNLILQKDFASDTAGRQLLKTDTLYFNTMKEADYGKVVIRLKNIDLTQNPVLQFVQNNQVVISVPVKDGFFSQNLFIPGDYNLRILYDKNDNGKWDPGQFFGEKRQPEIVQPVQRTITVKPAWDNEFDIAL